MDVSFLIPHYPLSNPLEFVLTTQGFGANDAPYYKQLGLLGHNGTDFRALNGTACYAVIDGTVIEAGQDWQGGRVIRIRTAEVECNGKKWRLEFIYYHLDSWLVLAGEMVWRGQPIGFTDNTGRYSTAPHLHFGMEVHWFEDGIWKKDTNNGYWGCVDSAPFFNYVPPMNNPYGIAANTLVQLTEGVGGFGFWSGEKFYVDELDKILASWMVRNQGNIKGKTLAVAQVVWDAYTPKYNLKNIPL